MAAGEVAAATATSSASAAAGSAPSRGRKSSTPSASSGGSRPSSARPQPPKRAHTSAISTASLRTITKANAAASSTNGIAKAKNPLLSPAPRTRTPHSAAPKTPSPNYFGLQVDEDANPPDSDAGKHAKQNWGNSYGDDEASFPLEDDPRYESFRRQSEQHNQFKLAQAGLSRFSTDGRVPTLKSLHKVQEAVLAGGFVNGDYLHLPLSAGGRVEQHVGRMDASNEDEYDADKMQVDHEIAAPKIAINSPSYFGLPRYESPQQGLPERPEIQRNPLSAMTERHGQNSLPHARVTDPHESSPGRKPRAETLPSRTDVDAPDLLDTSELKTLLDKTDPEAILLLDLRVSPQYAQARLKGALNLCIPTTLLKRSAFNVKRLADSFTASAEKTKFSEWEKLSHIVVYDASSIQLKDAQSGVNTLKKFRDEGFKGKCFIVKGGFNSLSTAQQELIERPSAGSQGKQAPAGLKLSLPGHKSSGGVEGMQVAGGCPMPDNSNKPANPFFGNIRQNMDLVDGVGQMAIKRPAQLDASNLRGLPSWLRDVVDEEEEGKLASERFLSIEKAEQKRMQKAYSTKVLYESPKDQNSSQRAKTVEIQIAGIEKGGKNRYKDILPYEHARVKLHESPSNDFCDYINASYVKAQWSHRRYIATQAPVPSTFKDFWSLVWEQDVRVLVVLTAESENGQRKCHPYWKPDTYGHYKIKSLSEKIVSLERPTRASLLDPNRKVSMPLSQMLASKDHPSRMQRRATLMGEGDVGAGGQANGPDAPPKEPPMCKIRKLALTDIQQPFVPLREIVQIEYTGWPDFGAPAQASELLTLVETVDEVVRLSNNAGKRPQEMDSVSSPTLPTGLASLEEDESKWPVSSHERPVVVHCSAGCGRTGTFVTIDSVVDMLKRQRLVASRQRNTNRRRPSANNVKAPRGARLGGHGEPNPFEISTAAAAASADQRLGSPTDSIVSPTSRMDLDSPKKRRGNSIKSTGFGSIDAGLADGNTSEESSDDDDDDDDNESDEDEDLDTQEWVQRDDIDLVQKTVEELRLQRLSMVQNLRQFTLCYEGILEWLVREMPERFRRENFRKSYQG